MVGIGVISADSLWFINTKWNILAVEMSLGKWQLEEPVLCRCALFACNENKKILHWKGGGRLQSGYEALGRVKEECSCSKPS